MSYNTNIPQTSDPIVQSAPQLRANFKAINNAFASNHVGLTQDATIAGMHQILTMRPQTGDPTTSSSQIAIYDKQVSYSGVNQPNLFFRPNSDQTPIQMTYPSIKVDGSTTQYSFMAGPFVIYGGYLPTVTNGQGVTLSPSTNLIYVDIVVQYTNNIDVYTACATTVSGNTFNISYAASHSKPNVWYTAVGV